MTRRLNLTFDPPSRHSEDAQLRAAIAELLTELPPEHEARVAFDRGDSTPEITRLLTDRPDINDLVKAVFRQQSRRQAGESMKFDTGSVSPNQRHG